MVNVSRGLTRPNLKAAKPRNRRSSRFGELGSAEVKVEIDNKQLQELLAKLEGLPKKIGRLALRSAVQAGATTMAKKARQLAPKGDGHLRKGIKARTFRSNEATTAISVVESWVFYGRFIEYGHKLTRVKGYIPAQSMRLSLEQRQKMAERSAGKPARKGQYRDVVNPKTGRVKRQKGMPTLQWVYAKPFMRPAFDSGKEEVINSIARVLSKKIEQAAEGK